MRCKIVRFQKLMWRNIMRSTKSQKASVLYYSIDIIRAGPIGKSLKQWLKVPKIGKAPKF